jgi:uncharacterized membrane protein (UPF0127 family)
MNKKKIIIAFIAALIATSIYYYFKKKNTPDPITTNTEAVKEPVFTREGTLFFIGEKDTISRIAIEIADNPEETTQGLMHRKIMPDSPGMLFKFDEPNLHAFWMKNTIIPLDIIYVDENLSIVDIQKYTTPYSTTSLPSSKPIKFAVEVNAGYCDKRDIKVSDKIYFRRL